MAQLGIVEACGGVQDERGQTTIEYLCLLVGLVALAGVLTAQMPHIARPVTCAFRAAIARVSDAGGCTDSGAGAIQTHAGRETIDDAIAGRGSIMGPPGGAGEVGRGPTSPGGRGADGGSGEGGGRGEPEGGKPEASAWRTYAIARDEVIERLDRESEPATTPSARGRVIVVDDPRRAAYGVFRELTRGPGVERVSKTANQWTVRTPEGREIRLRNPHASGSGDWTVDVKPPGGNARNEVHYKFRQR